MIIVVKMTKNMIYIIWNQLIIVFELMCLTYICKKIIIILGYFFWETWFYRYSGKHDFAIFARTHDLRFW